MLRVCLGGSVADINPFMARFCVGSSCTGCVDLGGSVADINPFMPRCVIGPVAQAL